MAVFLSDTWFNEVDRLTQEAGDLNVSPALANSKINVEVTDSSQGNVEAYLENGILKKGQTEAPTKVKIDEATLRDIAIKGDTNAAMAAFMSGKIRVDGDMSQLMALQSAKPSDEQKVLFDKIKSVTDNA